MLCVYVCLFVCVCLWLCVHECGCSRRPEVLDPRGPGVTEEVVIQLTWILETELGSLEKQYVLLTTEISI